MSSNPYDFPWWSGAQVGAGGSASVGTGGSNTAARAYAVTQTAALAAQAARAAAARGAAAGEIVAAARAAALPAWRDAVAGVSGAGSYESNEPGIFDYAASLLNPVTSAATPVVDTSSRIAGNALRDVTGLGLAGLLGSAGTLVLVGAGALILLVLLKR